MLTVDEYRDVLKLLIKCNIDLNQGINYGLNSDYKPAVENFLQVIRSLSTIVDKLED